MKQSTGVIIGVLAVVATSSRVALAGAIDFQTSPSAPAGTVSYAGGATPLMGSDIPIVATDATGIVDIVGVGTPLNNSVGLDCIDCQLSFTTGDFSGVVGNMWKFSDGRSIMITGGVDFTGDMDANDPQDIPTGTTLLSGTLVGDQLVTNGVQLMGALGFQVAGTDLAPKLLSFYGLPSNATYGGGSNLTIILPDPATGDPFAGSVIKENTVVSVPIANSLPLFLTGLVAIGFWRRQRFGENQTESRR